MTPRDKAWRKWQTLRRMTTERGCTPHEAHTARRLAASLAARWGFERTPEQKRQDQTYEERYARAEQRAARRFKWEYRKCGKPRCHCVSDRGHGPYKYGKKRSGNTVVSIYLGR